MALSDLRKFAKVLFGLKEEIEKLLKHEKVVAIGEVGLDKHAYTDTKYERYQIDPEFLACQKALLKEQIRLAVIPFTFDNVTGINPSRPIWQLKYIDKVANSGKMGISAYFISNLRIVHWLP